MFNLICLMRGHKRSRGRVREISGQLHGVCRRCGAEMVRLKPGKWVMARGASIDDEAAKTIVE